MIYDNLKPTRNSVDYKSLRRGKETVNFDFYKGAFLEVLSQTPARYSVEFSNGTDILYKTEINNNEWAKCLIQYYVPYKGRIVNLTENRLIYESSLDLKNKHVAIEFCSKSLGDTISWLPYAEEFRKKHDCKVTVVTFHNHLFANSYPDLYFSGVGEVINNVYAWYEIGWFYSGDVMNRFKHPRETKDQPLQKTASDILGLDFVEIRPKVDFTSKDSPIPGKYVCIANHSTAQIKYWNHPTGWQELVDYLKAQGYTVVLLSSEPDGYMGNNNPVGVVKPVSSHISDTMNYLYHSDFFIGIGSGLSWLNWAMNKPTVLISGFSEPYTEMQEAEDVIRIGTPEGFVTGAFNKYKLDAGDWNWCPYPGLKGTDRQWEDSASITPQIVIDRIKPFIK